MSTTGGRTAAVVQEIEKSMVDALRDVDSHVAVLLHQHVSELVSEIHDARRQVLEQSSANKQLRRQVVELKKATAQNENFEKQNQIFNQRRLKVSTEYSPEEDTAMNLAEEALIESKTLEDSISEHRQALQEERAELEAVSERGSLERLNSERIEQELKPIVAQVSLLEKELGQMEKTVKGNKILLNKAEKLRRGSIEWK
jgi:phage shock protein A